LNINYIFVLVFAVVMMSACAGQPPANSDAPAPAAQKSAPVIEKISEESSTEENVEAEIETETEESSVQAEVSESEEVEKAEYIFIEGASITTGSGLQYAIIEQGDGPSPNPGDIVQVHYTGRLRGGAQFDSSYDRDQPIQFGVGAGQVIPGWDEAILLLKVGDKARLVIPPELAYGEQGVGSDIPPNSTLYFDVELMDVQPVVYVPPTEIDEADYVTTDSGLKYYDLKVGDGDTPRSGEMPLVHYVAWLEDGTKIDSSRDRGSPIHFTLGVGQVLPGWDEGILSMQVGGKRQLILPPELAYGDEGAGDLIPPHATLIYEVELVAISDYHP